MSIFHKQSLLIVAASAVSVVLIAIPLLAQWQTTEAAVRVVHVPFSTYNRSATAPTRTIASASPAHIVGFVNNTAGQIVVPEAVANTAGTAKEICEMAGYRQVVSHDSLAHDGRRNFTSPNNNLKTIYLGHGNWVTDTNAGLQWLASLTCTDPFKSTPTPTPTPAGNCADGKDNDGDGFVDRDDPNCRDRETGNYNKNRVERTKHNSNSCIDGKDNDGDGKIDIKDPDCHEDDNINKPFIPGRQEDSKKPTPTPTPNPKNTCSDGKDNDGDGFADRKDPSCYDGETYNPDKKEVGKQSHNQCVDGKHNGDKDGRADRDDAQCHAESDLTKPFRPHFKETRAGGTCVDGKNNNRDPRIDGADPSCRDKNGNFRADWNETNPSGPKPTPTPTPTPNPAGNCADGLDNDNDGFIDRQDPNCYDRATGQYDPTNVERTKHGSNSCIDRKDNDGDGKIDAADPDCHADNDPNDGDNSFVPGFRERSGANPPTGGNDNDTNDNDNNNTNVINITNNNESNASTGEIKLETGETNVTTGAVNVNVTSPAGVTPVGVVAGAHTVHGQVAGASSVPVSAKTGASGIGVLLTILGGTGFAAVRRFVA